MSMARTTPPKGAARSDATARAGNTVNKAAQGAREMVDKVAGMADEAVRKAIPAAQQFAHKAVDNVEANAAPAAAWLGEHADDLNAAQEKILADTRNYIRENPMKSIGIALVVGLL